MKHALYKQKKIQVASLALFLFLVLFLDIGGVFTPVRSAFWTIISPIATPLSYVSSKMGDTVSLFSSLYTIHDENERLFSEKKRLEARIAQLERFEEENKMLKKELDVYEKSEKDLLPARIIGFDNPGSKEWIIMNKGKSAGIKEGQPVLAHSSVLIGSVEEVYPFSSRVKLLTSGESVVNIHIVENGAKGVVRGRYGLGIQLDMILSTEVISSGDRVMTSELGAVFPENLFIGTLREVYLDEEGVYQKAFVDQGISLGDLELVFVMK